MDLYSLAFSVSNLGPKSHQKLINKFGSPKLAWEGRRYEFEELEITGLTYKKFDEFRKKFDITQYTRQLKKKGVVYFSFFDKEYPQSFKKLDNPPIGIFCKGNLDLLCHSDSELDSGEESQPEKILRNAQDDKEGEENLIKIAVVGTRKITSYGKNVTEAIVSELSNNNVCIVSGLALGVDALSHRTALENNGGTVAVLACGVDCCLPSENFSLYNKILEKRGLIVSEYPLSQPPNKGTFLARNRLIAALSDGVLVTEAAEDSGSLVTADYGLKLGKKVYAVPGPITSRMSDGSLKLLKQGAKLVTSAEDILEEFKIQSSKFKVASKKFKNLSIEEKKIISLLENESLTIDEISREASCPISKLFIVVSGLELKGIVKSASGKVSLK